MMIEGAELRFMGQATKLGINKQMISVAKMSSPCCRGVHVEGKALGLSGRLHNYIGVPLTGPRLTSADVALERDH